LADPDAAVIMPGEPIVKWAIRSITPSAGGEASGGGGGGGDRTGPRGWANMAFSILSIGSL
jgi:hypothetical protein